jgi:hypothetical protein
MTLRTALRRFAAQRRATTTVEFGLVGSMMLLATFGTLDLGMLLWTQTALQSTAALAARCASISPLPPLCPDVKAYAVSLGNGWTMPGVVSATNVAVTSVVGCNGATGNFQQVAITASLWATSLPWPLNGHSLTATACYPTLEPE